MFDTEAITQTIRQELSASEFASLANASQSLSERYRNGNYACRPLDRLERYAYLLARLPATSAVIAHVLTHLKQRFIGFSPNSILDVGAGPGTASLVAHHIFDSISSAQLIERDPSWIRMGQALFQNIGTLSKADWINEDISKKVNSDAADLVVIAYALQEIPHTHHSAIAEAFLEKTKGALVIIEPGTPKGFANVRALRERLISLGSHIVAPCPNELPCPIVGSDWCHFSERVQRSQFHRRLKHGTMGYEDEKYSYLVVSHQTTPSFQARVVRRPMKRKGHLILDLCTDGALTREIVTRSQKDKVRVAKKLEWGSVFELPQ